MGIRGRGIEGKIGNIKREIEIKKIIAKEGRITAYQLHKKTGYPLSSVQYILKGLDNGCMVSIVEHQKQPSKKRGLERKYYDLTFFGVMASLVLPDPSFLDSIKINDLLQLIERGAMAEGMRKDDILVQIMRTALEMDRQSETYDFTVAAARFVYDVYSLEILALACAENTAARWSAAYLKYIYLQRRETERIKKERRQSDTLEIVLWKSGFFDKIADDCASISEEIKELSKDVSERYKDLKSST